MLSKKTMFYVATALALPAIATFAGAIASPVPRPVPAVRQVAAVQASVLYYTYNEADGTAEVRIPDTANGESTYQGDIVIPDMVSFGGRDYLVTSIGENAFSRSKVGTVTSVVFGSNITEIKKSAFFNQTTLTRIVFNDNVTVIDDYAFQNNKLLTSVTIPASVESLGRAFYQCTGLTGIIFEGAPETMKGTFEGCTALTSVNIPEGVVVLDGTFSGCTALCSVTLPSTLTTIENSCFRGAKLVDVVVPEGVETIGTMSFGAMNGTNNTNRTLRSVSLPSSLRTLSYNAFNNCAALQSLVVAPAETALTIKGSEYYAGTMLDLPASISNLCPLTSLELGRQIIGESGTDLTSSIFASKGQLVSVVFDGSVVSTPNLTNATGLTEVTVNTPTIPVCGGFSEQTYANASISVPQGREAEYAAAEGWKNFAKLEVPVQTQTLYYTYNEADGTAEVRYPVKKNGETEYSGDIVIPATTAKDGRTYLVTSVGEYAFADYYSYTDKPTSVVIGENVTEIKSNAFRGQDKIASVTFNDNITTIGDYAFQANHALTTITIPASVETLGAAFLSCQGLEEVVFAGTGCTSLNGTFEGCYRLKSVVLPDGLETIGSSTFSDCSALASVTFPSTLRSIGDWAFNGTALTEIILPEGLETIGDMALGAMNGTNNTNRTVTKVVIPGSVTSMAYNVFNNLGALADIEFSVSETPLKISGNSYYAGQLLTQYSANDCPIVNLVLGRQIVDQNGSDLTSTIFAGKTTLKDVTLAGSVTASPDFSKSEGIKNVTVTCPVMPVCGGFAQWTYDNAILSVPQGQEADYAAAEGWKNFAKLEVPEDKPLVDVDFAKIDWTVGEGMATAALVIRWNDNRGMDNLVMGIAADGSASADDIIASAVAANRRFAAVEGGYTYDLNGNGTLTQFDHNLANASGYEWTVTEAANTKGQRVVVLDYAQPGDGDFTAPGYLFYIPSDDKTGAWTASDYPLHLSDATCQIPVYVNVGQGGVASSISVSVYADATSTTADKTVISAATVSNSRLGQTMATVTWNESAKPATLYLSASTRYQDESGTYVTSAKSANTAIDVLAPEVPMTDYSLAIEGIEPDNGVYNLSFGSQYKLAVVPQPANATYTRVVPTYNGETDLLYFNATTRAITTYQKSGDFAFTAVNPLDAGMSRSLAGHVALNNPVTAITIPGVDENGELHVTYNTMLAVNPVITPANADIQTVDITVADPTMARIYNARTTSGTAFYELSTFKVGTTRVTYKATDGSGVEYSFTLVVEDRDRTAQVDYTAGMFWLSEEWFGHNNGSINFVDDQYNVTYKAYERQNPWMSFGCTSQFATVHADRLIVMSKQADDGGDPRQGGGRVVIADAKSLKRLASFDDFGYNTDGRSMADGRAAVGVGADKIYIGLTSGIRVCRIDGDTYTLDPANIAGISNGSAYSGQVGDMVCAGNYVFAVQQGVGMHIIDTATDCLVKTVSDASAQTIVQSADGNVWLASGNTLHCYDPATLDEVATKSIGQSITVQWGSWRSGSFKAAKSSNVLFWAVGGNLYRWDIDTEDVPQTPLYSLGTVEGMNGAKQAMYGTIGYDDHNDRLLFATTHGSASNYRYNWYYFVNATTGELEKCISLDPYYWFPAMPVNPDRHDVQFHPDFGEIVVDIKDGETEVDLSEFITDPDDIDYNIRLSLADAPAVVALSDGEESLPVKSMADIVDYSVKGLKLTLTPKQIGQARVTVTTESRGRVVSTDVALSVQNITAADDVVAETACVTVNGSTLRATGCAGMTLTLTDMNGRNVFAVNVDSDVFTANLTIAKGVYVLRGIRQDVSAVTRKVVVK